MTQDNGKNALIIGAGPAGLTAAYELIQRSNIKPIVLEKSLEIGGISRTVQYRGNRMDIGGHRFFSKSDRVMDWWLRIMPVEGSRNAASDPASIDRVMLVRTRRSRIYFLRKFFDYPIKLSGGTLRNLGVARTLKIGLSYAATALRRKKPETTLEEFLINRFGRELYLTFFKAYTEKVWGVPCDEISAEWGAQRIKGLSAFTAITHFLKSAFRRKGGGISQKQTETSLIEEFLYPKLGPGQLWEYVAGEVNRGGGCVQTGWSVERLLTDGFRVTGVEAVNGETGERRVFEADYVFSTMPVKELIRGLDAPAPPNVQEVAEGLLYRDFITVGLLLRNLKVKGGTERGARLLTDNWIYIQEPDVLVGRMQIFNNWSPYLVADPSCVWIGLEYFCSEADGIWGQSDEEMIALAKAEVEKIGLIDSSCVLDGCVVRVPKAYPAYFGTYARFQEVRDYTDRFHNLFLIGRNGMHKYNNQDHSMLTAMTAVDNLLDGVNDKSGIWALNTETDYHESKG
jgi:protoporphyrinogen oxidase